MAEKISFLTRILLLLLSVLGWNSMAAAQQPQEKRVALVVGDGAYAKSPLATAANDAGLIAQTLQAAGFDVIGARDLDADSLRKSFHDFMQKAQADPANTVAVIYLAGYGAQLSGENYFIAVDSNVNSATDIPIEGLRISDYARELASVPLKASVVILDVARQQPFIDGGPQPLAGGLALVEASPNSLIAFNAAPGTVAPTETGSYGLYAQSLAEMIRTGGLSLPDVFDRLRLRVSENSKGAQVPWDDQKITAQFTFFDRAPDAPKEVGAGQVAAIRDKPMGDLSVTDAYAAALERDTMQGYQDFLAAYPSDPMSKRVRAILAARREAITWRRTYLADTPQAYWSYLKRYPDGPHAWDARRRLATLNALLQPPPSFAMIDYDVSPPPPDEIVYVDRPVVYFGDPDFDFPPPPPPPVYFLPPPPPDFVVLAPPIVAVGLFLLPRPMFVPIPAYVRPPVYVQPPANNVVFNNIHNTTVINNVINNPAPAATGAASLPNNVSQRASLIQQGKLPPPQSATINATAKPGAATVTPANTTSQPQFRRENALPVPGKGNTPAAPVATTPTTAAPGTLNPNAKGANPRLTSPTANTHEEKLNPAAPGKPAVTSTQPLKPGELEKRNSATQAPVKPEQKLAKPEVRPVTTPAKPALPPASPKQEAKRVASPPPPPRPAAVPAVPKPPAIAARPTPPPAPHRPPPPRPAPPKPPPAAKKCPPNAKKC
jgi:uncharacterized caspase-like protein